MSYKDALELEVLPRELRVYQKGTEPSQSLELRVDLEGSVDNKFLTISLTYYRSLEPPPPGQCTLIFNTCLVHT